MIAIKYINLIMTLVFTVLCLYQVVYIPISLFVKRKDKPKSDRQNKIAVLICARNERNVITDLIDCVKNQTYPYSNVGVFVLADNCTDDTAEVCRNAGAVVYERFNTKLIGKSYALKELFAHIKEDYPGVYDAFLIMDADNLLAPDYLEKMNESFNCGHKVITSYRASKNFGDNWVAASSSIWFMRECRYLHYPRYILHSSCAVGGTGYMISKEIMNELGDWHFHTLTEDLEFSYAMISRGEKIAFCKDAVFYDEQPTKFSQSWSQRKRWVKGGLQAFLKNAKSMFKGIFRGIFACYDMITANILFFVYSILSTILNTWYVLWGAIRHDNILIAVESLGMVFLGMYGLCFVMGFMVIISEWKLIHAKPWKKIVYSLLFPVYMLLYIPICIVALFSKVEWKPIEHNVKADDTDINTK